MKIKYLALAAFAGFIFQACDNDDVKSVPTQVKQSFQSKYPGVNRVEWELEKGYYVADFIYDRFETEAWFDNDGKWYLTETDLSFAALPETVKLAFEQSNYATWRVDDIDRVERSQEETRYVIEVEDGRQEYELHYITDGTLVLEQPDRDGDFEYWP